MGLKTENKSTVSPDSAFNTTKCRNLSNQERTAIKDHLLVCCTLSPTDPLKLPPWVYIQCHSKEVLLSLVSLSTVKRIWYQYKDSASKNKDGVGDVGNKQEEEELWKKEEGYCT